MPVHQRLSVIVLLSIILTLIPLSISGSGIDNGRTARAGLFITTTTYLPVIHYIPPPGLNVIISPYRDTSQYSSYVTYYGEFFNNTDTPVRWVDATFAFYDDQGQLIAFDDSMSHYSMAFDVGDRICWYLWVRKDWGPPTLHSVEYEPVQFSGDPHNVHFQDFRLINDPTDLRAVGEIYNGGPDQIERMNLTVTLYDRNNHVIDCDPYIDADPDPLPVGQTALFQANFDDDAQPYADHIDGYLNFYRSQRTTSENHGISR